LGKKKTDKIQKGILWDMNTQLSWFFPPDMQNNNNKKKTNIWG